MTTPLEIVTVPKVVMDVGLTPNSDGLHTMVRYVEMKANGGSVMKLTHTHMIGTLH